MNPAILNSQFVQVALPIVLTIFIAAWMNGRSFDGINKRIDEVIARLGRIEAKLDNHTERIVRLETQASPIARVRG